jgi:hypothetical protein
VNGLPQQQEGIPDLICYQEGALPHFHNEVRSEAWMHFFAIVGSDVEALWNGLRDRLN